MGKLDFLYTYIHIYLSKNVHLNLKGVLLPVLPGGRKTSFIELIKKRNYVVKIHESYKRRNFKKQTKNKIVNSDYL